MPTAMVHDIGTGLTRKQVFAPQLLTATATKTNVDMIDADGRCALLIDVGTWNATSATIQVNQCATTNGVYTNITGASISVTTGTTLGVVTFDRDYRYLGAVVTVSGTTIGYSASFVEATKTF